MKKLLLLHGALGSKKQFEPILKELSEKFEVYKLNFEGHGDIASDKEYSMDLFAQNTIDFLNTNSIDKINVFGYSMGGYVALKTALLHPEKIDSILTLGTKFDWTIEAATKEVKMLNPEKIEEKVPQFADKLKKEHPAHDWKEVVKKTAQMMMGLAEGEKLKEEEIKQIQHKAIIGIGELDKMVTYDESKKAANLLPNGKLVMLAEVKHPIDKVEPTQLISFIEHYL